MDEGFFHDEAAAPAVAYKEHLLYVATILGGAKDALLQILRTAILTLYTPLLAEPKRGVSA